MKQLEKFIIDLRFKIAHFLFMTRFFLGTFFISVIVGLWLSSSNPKYKRAWEWIFMEAKYQIRGVNHPEQKQYFYAVNKSYIEIARKIIVKELLYLGLVGLGIATLAVVLFSLYLKRKEKYQKEQVIRGAHILNKPLKLKGRIKVDEIVIPYEYENRGILVLGTAGSGKSAFTKHLLRSVRESIGESDKLIVFDRKGEYISYFYEEGDLILNPADKRSVKWDIFQEIHEKRDIDSVVTSLIPHTEDPRERFWQNSARDIFKALLIHILEQHQGDKPGNIDLFNYFTKINSRQKLVDSLKKTDEAISMVEGYLEDAGDTAASVYASFTEYANYFKNPDIRYRGDFSIRRWINNERGGVLFIANPPAVQDSYRAIYSLILDLAFKEILQLPDNLNRRIWLFIDEFPSLFKLENLERLLAEGRSKGSSPVLVAQDFTQVERVYGHGAPSIFNNANTKVCFRIGEPRSAEFISRFFGEKEVERERESLTMGTENYRDGYIVGKDREKTPVVLASELTNLPDLTCFVKIGPNPLYKYTISYPVMNKKTEGFIKKVNTDVVKMRG